MKTSNRFKICFGAALLLLSGVRALAAEFPQGLMVHYGFDEYPPGGVVPDKTGRGHVGRAVGIKWTAMGKQGGGLEFGATNCFIAVSNVPALNLTQATFSVWIRTSTAGAADRCLFDKQSKGGYGLFLAGAGADGKNKGRVKFVVDGHESLGDAAIADGQWHHAAATYDGANLKLYVDGVLQKQTTPFAGAIPANSSGITIGMNRTNPSPAEKGQSFEGTLDDVMIFNHAINAEQVLAVMAAAKPKFSKSQVTQRLAELKDLLDRGLILQDFYDRKVKECEASQ